MRRHRVSSAAAAALFRTSPTALTILLSQGNATNTFCSPAIRAGALRSFGNSNYAHPVDEKFINNSAVMGFRAPILSRVYFRHVLSANCTDATEALEKDLNRMAEMKKYLVDTRTSVEAYLVRRVGTPAINADEYDMRIQELDRKIYDLRRASELADWLLGVTWKSCPSAFTQVPEWDCLGRTDIEMRLRRSIESTSEVGEKTKETTQIIQIVSAPRQGKSLMLTKIGTHYMTEGWTVVPVTFNGAETIPVPDCPSDDPVVQSKFAIMELWSRVLASSASGSEDIDTCRHYVSHCGIVDGRTLASLLRNVFGGKPVLLLVDEISFLTDKFPTMSPQFAVHLGTFLTSAKLVYTTFDAKMNMLLKTGSGRVAVSAELPLLRQEKEVRLLLPQKAALRVFCEREDLPFLFYYNILKSSPGTLGALLDPSAESIPIFTYLADGSSDHIWGDCLRPYIIESISGVVSKKTADLLMKYRVGVQLGQLVVPTFLAVFILSRELERFPEDAVWRNMHSSLTNLRSSCDLFTDLTNDPAHVRGKLLEQYVRSALLLRGVCGRNLKPVCKEAHFTDHPYTIYGVSEEAGFDFHYPEYKNSPERVASVLSCRQKANTFYFPVGKMKSGGKRLEESNPLLDGFYFIEDGDALVEYWIQVKNTTNIFGELSRQKGITDKNFSGDFKFVEMVDSGLSFVDKVNADASAANRVVKRVVHVIVCPTVGSSRRQMESGSQFDSVIEQLATKIDSRDAGSCAYELQIVAHWSRDGFSAGDYPSFLSPALAYFVPDCEAFEEGSWQSQYVPLAYEKYSPYSENLATREGRSAFLRSLDTQTFDIEKAHAIAPATVKRVDVEKLSAKDKEEYVSTLAKCVVANAYAQTAPIKLSVRLMI